MIYKMKLYSDSFEKIKFGSKAIEMRLNDEKRKAIKIGDFIEFTNNTTNKKYCVKLLIYINIKILKNYINIIVK